MSKVIKVPDGVWKTLSEIKIRDNKKSLGEVIYDLLVKAKEVKQDEKTKDSSDRSEK